MLNFKKTIFTSQKGLYFRAAAMIFAIALGAFVINTTSVKTSARDFLNNLSWFISPSDPYLQNWSDTVSINTDDNWDNFIAITGFRGDNLTTGVGVDPQTVLAPGDATPIDVIANQSNPNTLVQGGVAEFDGLANPTVALKGDDTADAPNLLIRLNTKNCPDSKVMTVAYNVRDLDSTANNAVQQVALQYRLGFTGNFTNVPGAFVADATNPNSATKVSSVFATLPHLVLSQDILFLRIMTTNAAGNDEWVGIDDITVGCFVTTAAEAVISGKVMNSQQRGYKGATVIVTDREGNNIIAKTNQFGNYRVNGIFVGETYIIHAYSKNNTYTPKIVVISSDRDDLDFTPDTSNDLIAEQKSPPK
ncbi:MAG: carboxypeptidase-like regulatory domain-containing protein [Pyrinomonadaceae bacterium]|nr:carboxypeptidase-like regulatory domain-containing protein [Pyrinomonadaceae bacterium]